MVSTMVDPVTVYRARFEDQLQTEGAPLVPEFGLELHWPATPFLHLDSPLRGALLVLHGAMIFLCQIQSPLQVTKKQQLKKKWMVASHQDVSGISPNSILVLAMMIVMWSSVAVISGCQGSSGSCSCELCNNCSKAVKTLASVFSAACLIVCGPMDPYGLWPGYGQRNWVPPNVTKMVLF